MKNLCAILAVTGCVAVGFAARAELVDGVKVVVHDSVITYQQVDDATAATVNPQMWTRMSNEQRARLDEENTQRLVERELILHEFETSGYSVPESVIDEYMQQEIRTDYGGSRASMAKSLQKSGQTMEGRRQEWRDRFIVSQMRLKNVSDALIISPHKIEVYYVNHTNDFKVEDQVKLRMIVLNKNPNDPEQARRLAEEILSKIDAGASFAEMASVYSQDATHRADGGSWDWTVTSGMRKEFAEPAASLNPGDHSKVIETADACYLMQVDDKKQAHIRPLSEVRAEIEDTLLREERQRLNDQWIGRLKKKTFVRYF